MNELHYQTISWKCVKDRQERVQTIVLNGSVGQCFTLHQALSTRFSYILESSVVFTTYVK